MTKRGTSLLLKILAGLVALACIAAIVTYQGMLSFLKGDEFRQLASAKTSETLGVESAFSPFNWSGSMVESDAFTSTDGSLSAQRISAEVDISGLRRRTWDIPLVTVERFTAINYQTNSKKIPEKSKPRSFLQGLLPNKTLFGEISIRNLSITQGEASLSGSSAIATSVGGGRDFDIVLSGGSIQAGIPLFSETELVTATARIRGDGLFLTDAQLTSYDSGRITASGESSSKGYFLGGEISHIPCEELLPADWQKRLTGTLHADFQAASDTPVHGHAELKSAVLTALPFLDTVAAYTNIQRFRRLTLNRAECQYSTDGHSTQLTDIHLEQTGLVALRGDITITGEQLDGTLEVGVTPGTLSAVPGAETSVFISPRDGMAWTTVKIGGTLENPQEDLTQRLIDAAGERLFRIVPETGKLALRFANDAVSESTKELLEQSRRALDDPTQVLEQGVEVLGGAADSLLEFVPGGGFFQPSGAPERLDN